MADKFYAKGPGNNGYIKNLEVLDFNPWNGKSGRFPDAGLQNCRRKILSVWFLFGGTQNWCN